MSKVVSTILRMKKHSTELTIAFNNTSFNYYNFYSRCFVRALTRFIVVKDDLFQLLSFACAIGLKLQDPRVKEAIEGKVLIGL